MGPRDQYNICLLRHRGTLSNHTEHGSTPYTCDIDLNFKNELLCIFLINHNILTHDEKKIQPAGGGFLDNFSRDSVPLT